MPKVPYPKQIQTFANQIGILKQRGMTFADVAAAETWLRRVSYYRMSGYWYPLLADRVNHTFKPCVTFEQRFSYKNALFNLFLPTPTHLFTFFI
ncbi:MAG: Abi family protein [Prevotella sp.]|nr:Abi family protein [Prevotella sp.]